MQLITRVLAVLLICAIPCIQAESPPMTDEYETHYETIHEHKVVEEIPETHVHVETVELPAQQQQQHQHQHKLPDEGTTTEHVTGGDHHGGEGEDGLIGCYKDKAKRDLPEVAYTGYNSVAKCRDACKRLGYKYAGMQYSSWCFCGNSYGKYGEATNCKLKCNGNQEQTCGGAWASNVYRASRRSRTTESIRESLLVGCFKDAAKRDLPEVAYTGRNSVFKCRNECKRRGYKYAGVQYSSWCFCGNSYGTHGEAHNCNMKCNANNEQTCGGVWANNVYRVSDESRSTESIRESLHLGCFKDKGKRDLPAVAYTGYNSMFKCRNECGKLGYKYAGVQYSSWCFCGNSYGAYGEATNCKLKCNGNQELTCGGAWASNVYRASRGSTTESIGESESIGCFRDKGKRDLPEVAYTGKNSVFKCRSTCKRLGFKFAGLQYSSWCFCGNSYGSYGKASNCNLKCNANSKETCGGAWASNVYHTSP